LETGKQFVEESVPLSRGDDRLKFVTIQFKAHISSKL
jgi:hypothetical protein